MNPAQLSEWGRKQWAGPFGLATRSLLIAPSSAIVDHWFAVTVQNLGERATTLRPGEMAVAMLEWRLMMVRRAVAGDGPNADAAAGSATSRAYGDDPYAKPQRTPAGEYFPS